MSPVAGKSPGLAGLTGKWGLAWETGSGLNQSHDLEMGAELESGVNLLRGANQHELFPLIYGAPHRFLAGVNGEPHR